MQRNWMNIEYQYCVCHGGQRWLVWGLVEALVSIQWIRIAQIDTKTHLPTELILHSLPFGRFFCFLYQLHPFLYSFSWLLKGERWHVPGHVCGIFFIIIFLNPAISSVTFADCRVTGSYIFPLPPLSLSLWNRSFVCEQLKQNGRRIQSSAGNASRAEMLLGKETGKRQKTSPLTASVHMTLGPEWARKEAGGGTAQQALVHTQRN